MHALIYCPVGRACHPLRKLRLMMCMALLMPKTTMSLQRKLTVAFLPVVASNQQECVDGVIEGKDYFEHKVEPIESTLWSVSYENTYKVVTNIAADETYLLLYQCGTEPPEDQLDGRHSAAIAVPVQDVGLLYTTMIPFIELLGVRTSVSAYFGSFARMYLLRA